MGNVTYSVSIGCAWNAQLRTAYSEVWEQVFIAVWYLQNPSCLCFQGLVAVSRVGVYIRLPGVDVAKFEQSMQGGGLLGYIDALSGGSISKVGVFSLGNYSQR